VDSYRFEAFDEGSPTARLRWFDRDGTMSDRLLDRAGLDAFTADVDRRYRANVPNLAELGASIYRWLDGPSERWLARARERELPMLVYIDCDERLRHLPWELMHDSGFLAVNAAAPLSPVRLASSRQSDLTVAANRPLRVMFMASSPVDVTPELDFEREEAMILEAATGLVEVVVEESGSIEGLASWFSRYDAGYFDVLHLSGHALVGPGGPRFVLESDIGMRVDASAAEIAAAIDHRWPPLIFLSGCETGTADDAGEVASIAEALVTEGAPAVLGWALPVGDIAASRLAAELYRTLANGKGRDWAATSARRALYASDSPYWHLLRLFTDRTPLGPLVSAPGTKHRVRLRVRAVNELFLDQSGQVKVASGEGFVGRRRELQRCLRAVRPSNPSMGPNVLILHGMGGLGKSTLAARLLDRLRATHAHQAVWVGKIDVTQLGSLAAQLKLNETESVKVNELLALLDQPLQDRLRFVFDGPLADVPCVFVFDDFESGNLEEDGRGGHMATPTALEVVVSFAEAIATTASPSRVIITSRHDFVLPPTVKAVRQPLMELQGVDLQKKLGLTANLGPTSTLDESVRTHAVTASAGVPRLIERLDQLISDDETAHEVLLDAIDGTAVAFREELLLEQLLDHQEPDTRRLLALASIYEVPVPVEAIMALLPGTSIDHALKRAVAVGLIESGPHPMGGDQRYLVSNLLKPLLDDTDEGLEDDDRLEAYRLGARALYERWVVTGGQ
jgi:hypothetical protein